MTETKQSTDTPDAEALAHAKDREAGIVTCDACPVLCRIRPGRTGACDRYGNVEGRLARLDPFVIAARAGKDGVVPFLGAGWDVDTWLWGYERGLVTDKPRDLTVVAVNDRARAVDALRRITRTQAPDEHEAKLAALPAVYPRAVTWHAIEALRTAGDAFVWRV